MKHKDLLLQEEINKGIELFKINKFDEATEIFDLLKKKNDTKIISLFFLGLIQTKKKNPKLIQSDFENIVDAFCESLEVALTEGRNIELRGFGSFRISKIKEKHSARNPKTGELIYVPEKNRIRFKASKKFVD